MKNVTIVNTLYHGHSAFKLIHEGGSEDTYFSYFVINLIERNFKHNTVKNYVQDIALFIDYMVEAADWFRKQGHKMLDGSLLTQAVKAYPKFLAGGHHSRDPLVQRIGTALNKKGFAASTQARHIAALNNYLRLSESFRIRMHEQGVTDSDYMMSPSALFSWMNQSREIDPFQRKALTNSSWLAGCIAGAPQLLAIPELEPLSSIEWGALDGDYTTFPYGQVLNLINAARSYRDKAFWALLAASGCRISEAILLTHQDIDFTEHLVYLTSPLKKGVRGYGGYFSIEEINELPWKGRATKETLLIEPFATEFWKNLELYFKHEYLCSSSHTLIFQLAKGKNKGDPWFNTGSSNLVKLFKRTAGKIGEYDYSPHSLRHMYGCWCLNCFPSYGKEGLPESMVRDVMGHRHVETTRIYAKVDIERLRLEQRKFFLRHGDELRTPEEMVRDMLIKELEKTTARIETDKEAQRNVEQRLQAPAKQLEVQEGEPA